MSASCPERVAAPADHQDHQDGGELHDTDGLLAGLLDALDILPPEIKRHGRSKNCRTGVGGKDNVDVSVLKNFVNEAHQILAGRNAADWPGQDIVKHQR